MYERSENGVEANGERHNEEAFFAVPVEYFIV
jgi:hypothetical protein